MFFLFYLQISGYTTFKIKLKQVKKNPVRAYTSYYSPLNSLIGSFYYVQTYAFRFFDVQMFSAICYSFCAKCELLKVPEVLGRWCTDADYCYGVALPDFNCMWM